MKKNWFGDEKGVSVLEVLMVILIGSILVGVAVSQFGKSKMQMQRHNVAREFKNNLERARFDSVRRRVDDTDFANMSQVVLISSTKYEVRIDTNQDGVISNDEVRTVDFAQNSDSKILHATASFPLIIRFNRKGHITINSAGVPVVPLFTICSGVCAAATTITPENGNVVSISPTGTVAMLYGGDVVPPLSAPNITAIDANANINLWVSVGGTSYNAQTNTNSNAGNNPNSNSNTNTANPTPTPQPTPIPPTPTPTPPQLPVCAMGATVYVNGVQQCICPSPRRINGAGKCMN